MEQQLNLPVPGWFHEQLVLVCDGNCGESDSLNDLCLACQMEWAEWAKEAKLI